MNLIKIFTYGGVIEVFVVPHVLPCVVSFIPGHIVDMIRLGLTMISGLFPHVTVNVQSEVFLKVWNDDNDKLDAAAISDIDSDHSRRPSSQRSQCYNFSCDKRPADVKPLSSTTDYGRKPGPGDKDDVCPSQLINGVSLVQLHKAEQRKLDNGAAAISDANSRRQIEFSQNENFEPKRPGDDGRSLDDRNAIFGRSCSIEYQVKAADWRDTAKAPVGSAGAEPPSAVARSCRTCESQRAINESRKNPEFSKSCSLEYVTKLKNCGKNVAGSETVAVGKTGNGSELLSAEKGIIGWNWKPTEMKEKEITMIQRVSLYSSPKKPASRSTEAQKPVYFGDNCQNP